MEEFSDILREKAGLLHGGKVAAPRHDSLAQDIVAALGARARGNRKLLGEKGHRHGNLYAVCRRELKRPITQNPCLWPRSNRRCYHPPV